MASSPDNRKSSETRDSSRTARAEDATNAATDEAREAGERGAEAAAEATRSAGNVVRHAAYQGREALTDGMQRAAEATAPLAEIGFGEGRKVIEASAHITDLLREASDETAEDVQALTMTYAQVGHGMLRMQHAWLNSMQRSMARARRQPQDLLRCRTVTEMAEVQRDLYMDGVAFMLESSTTLLRLAGEIVQGAASPLEARAQARN